MCVFLTWVQCIGAEVTRELNPSVLLLWGSSCKQWLPPLPLKLPIPFLTQL